MEISSVVQHLIEFLKAQVQFLEDLTREFISRETLEAEDLERNSL